MQLFAEIPAIAELKIAGAGQSVPASSLPPAERDWWTQLSGHERLHRFETDDPFWRASVLIDDSAVSQFDVLVTAAQCGAPLPDSLACIALTGCGFHGNRHRPWQTRRGNLHFTSFCRLRLEAARCGAALSMLPTLAVTDLLLSQAATARQSATEPATPCWIKWINDVYLGDGKVAGSLVSSQVNGDWIESFVLGIGLNLAVTPAPDAAGWFGRAASLGASGIELPLAAAFPALRDQLARRIAQLRQSNGPEQLFRDYQDRSGIIGQVVTVHPEEAASPGDEPLAAGRLRAIHPDLSLEIEGCGERICRGRLALASAPPDPL